jgi:uncharacterized membrane protein
MEFFETLDDLLNLIIYGIATLVIIGLFFVNPIIAVIVVILIVGILIWNSYAHQHNKKEDEKEEEKKLYKTELIKERARLQAQKEFKKKAK